MSVDSGDLARRREAAMDHAERALAQWSERSSPECVRELQQVAAQLEQIAAEMQRSAVPPLELSRTHRYLGSVYADLAPASGRQSLVKAHAAYLQAERLLESSSDAIERAKLDFNFASTLRQLDANDGIHLRQAEERLLAAKRVFAERAPQYLHRVDEALTLVRRLLPLTKLAVCYSEALADNEQEGQVDFTPAELQAQMRTLASLVARRTSTALPEAKRLLRLLGDKLYAEIGAGRVSQQRGATLTELLDSIRKIVGADADESRSPATRAPDMRDAAATQFAHLHYLSHGIERPQPPSRAAQLVESCWALRRFLLEESCQPDKTGAEEQALADFSMRASYVDKRIYQAGKHDARARAVEAEAVRPLALEVRSFAARHHLLLANPIWVSAPVAVKSDAVVFAGSAKVHVQVAAACTKLGLDLIRPPKSDDFANARWRQLQAANVAVFDLSAADRHARVGAAYELGIARALGKAVVVLTHENQPLPFDVDVDPVLLSGATTDAAAIAEAIDRALVWTLARPQSSSLAATVREASKRYSRAGIGAHLKQTLKQLQSLEAAPDPFAVAVTLKTLIRLLGPEAPLLLHPVWPPVYADPTQPRLFHAMPSREPWCDAVSARVAAVCQERGVQYVRADQIRDASVVRSVWEEVNRATHVLADLTGCNANVAFELGIAHTLGGRTCVAIQSRGSGELQAVPMLARLRFAPYADAQSEALGHLVRSLLNPVLT